MENENMRHHKNIPSQLIKRRIELGMTQEEVCKLTGQHVTALSHWETGHRVPTIQNLIELSRALGCPIDWFLT